MKYAEMGRKLGELTEEKNKAYGDSFKKSGEILEVLYPDGIQPYQYQDALAIVRVIDKLFRIATSKDAFGESPWKDIAGYGILGAVGDEPAKFESVTAWAPKVDEKVRPYDGDTVGIVEDIEQEGPHTVYWVRRDGCLEGFYLEHLSPETSSQP